MKTHATIDWFEKPTPQATACISFNCKGLISFNSAARQLLPDYVDLGYDRHTRILYLREGKKRKGLSVRNTSGTLKPLTISMANSGITFPVRYEIQAETAGDSIWQAEARYYDEKTLLKKIRSIRDPKAARSSEEMQHLLLLYEETLRKICRSFSRSIPKADRFQLAQEGFLDGVLSYQHYLADFDGTSGRRSSGSSNRRSPTTQQAIRNAILCRKPERTALNTRFTIQPKQKKASGICWINTISPIPLPRWNFRSISS